MSRRSRKAEKRASEGSSQGSSLRRSIPWVAIAGAAKEGREHWNSQLSGRERKRLIELVKSSKGRPSSLTERERTELNRLVAQLDLRAFAKRALVFGAASRIGSGRRGR